MKVFMKNSWWSAAYVNGVPRMAYQTAKDESSKGNANQHHTRTARDGNKGNIKNV